MHLLYKVWWIEVGQEGGHLSVIASSEMLEGLFFPIPYESNDPFYNIWLSCFIVLYKVFLNFFWLHWLNT